MEYFGRKRYLGKTNAGEKPFVFQDATGTVPSLEQNPVFLPCDRCLRFRVFATFEHPTEAVRQAADNERTFWQH